MLQGAGQGQEGKDGLKGWEGKGEGREGGEKGQWASKGEVRPREQ